MRDLIYRGTPPVGPEATQAMLAGEFSALWSPPMYRHATPAAGDRLWLIWQQENDIPRLLGTGVIVATPEGRVDWTNRTAPGVVAEARAHGYKGPTNMAFLKLRDVRVYGHLPEIGGLGNLRVGLSDASPAQVSALEQKAAQQ